MANVRLVLVCVLSGLCCSVEGERGEKGRRERRGEERRGEESGEMGLNVAIPIFLLRKIHAKSIILLDPETRRER